MPPVDATLHCSREGITDELTPEVVRLAFRLMFGREPANEEIVARTIGYGTIERLRDAFLGIRRISECV